MSVIEFKRVEKRFLAKVCETSRAGTPDPLPISPRGRLRTFRRKAPIPLLLILYVILGIQYNYGRPQLIQVSLNAQIESGVLDCLWMSLKGLRLVLCIFRILSIEGKYKGEILVIELWFYSTWPNISGSRAFAVQENPSKSEKRQCWNALRMTCVVRI